MSIIETINMNQGIIGLISLIVTVFGLFKINHSIKNNSSVNISAKGKGKNYTANDGGVVNHNEKNGSF